MRSSETYIPDSGRTLTDEEKAEAAKTITPINEIKTRTCKRERNNDLYRLGRR